MMIIRTTWSYAIIGYEVIQIKLGLRHTKLVFKIKITIWLRQTWVRITKKSPIFATCHRLTYFLNEINFRKEQNNLLRTRTYVRKYVHFVIPIAHDTLKGLDRILFLLSRQFPLNTIAVAIFLEKSDEI